MCLSCEACGNFATGYTVGTNSVNIQCTVLPTPKNIPKIQIHETVAFSSNEEFFTSFSHHLRVNDPSQSCLISS
jgi:hypothetical protein